MKGVILNCIQDLVVNKFGENKWIKILETSGLSKDFSVLLTDDIDDNKFFEVFNNLCKVLNITAQQAFDAFADHWILEFAPKIYSAYFTGSKSAKDFLLKMDNVHFTSTKGLPGATPPRFGYNRIDDKTLIMEYKGQRGMVDLMISLIKSVGKYYKEDLKVERISENQVKITFEK